MALLLALATISFGACHRDSTIARTASLPSGVARVEVTDVGYDRASGSHYVQLDDRASHRTLQIVIGDEEARAIMLQLSGLKSPRPLPSELLSSVIALTGNAVDHVEVTKVRDEIYYAQIVLDRGRVMIDSRPSDAIALAMRTRTPIYVAGNLLRSPALAPLANSATPRTATKFGITVQGMTFDLASYFGIEPGIGVLVADFNHEFAPSGLQRGDVLVELNGQQIRSPGDFARTVVPEGSQIALKVRRGRVTYPITLTPSPVTTGTTD
jgi:uncharacterized protein